MNQGKRGAEYGYPDSFVQLLGYVKAYFHLPYRQTEGVVRAHAANKIPSIPNYSTINRRVKRASNNPALTNALTNTTSS
jgi:Transposase DDE domain